MQPDLRLVLLMAKKRFRSIAMQSKLHPWRVSFGKNTRTTLLGYVYAVDEKSAIDQVALEHGVPNELRSRLVAHREDR